MNRQEDFKKAADDYYPNGWHHASEPPKEDGEYVVFCYGFDLPFKAKYSEYINEWSHRDVKWWCYPPEKE